MQVVVDAIDPRCLVSGCVSHTLDFATTTEAELQDIRIPLSFPMGCAPCLFLNHPALGTRATVSLLLQRDPFPWCAW